MRILSMLLLVLLNCSSERKSVKEYCLVLQDIIQMPLFDKQFNFSRYPSKDFIIIDTGRVFFQCHVDSIHGRKVIINDTLYSKSEMIKNSNIILVAMGRKFEGRLITFGFWCPAHGGALTLHYEVKNGKLNLLGYSVGFY